MKMTTFMGEVAMAIVFIALVHLLIVSVNGSADEDLRAVVTWLIN